MLTFLRKIRRSMIDSGSTRKYLAYAIGEIMLVVLGILIALQINNWNEQRKVDEHELRLLHGLYQSMDNDVKGWNFIMGKNEECNRSYHIIMNHVSDQLPYSDTLNKHFNRAEFWWYHPLNKSAFETAKGYGLNFIENDDLIFQISDLYERLHGIYDDVTEYMEDFHFSVAAEFSAENFMKSHAEQHNDLKPIEYESLIANTKYQYIITQKWITRKNLLSWQERILERMNSSMELIEDEINEYE